MGTPRSYTILVAGLGALGTVFATLLKKAGHTVFGLTKDKYLPVLKDRRVHVTGIWGEHEVVLDGTYDSVEALKGEDVDLVILSVKSYDTETAIGQVKPLVGKDTLVIIAQNGYGNYETVAYTVGREHTLLSRVIFGVKLHEPGKSEVTVFADDVRIGQPHGAVPVERIEEIAGAFRSAGIPTQYVGNVYAILWDKILYNAALNPLGAILECTYGALAENAETRSIMNAVIDEIFQAARAQWIPLNWESPEAYRDHFYTKLVPPTARHFPSMYYDVMAGKRTEIDALNGAIVCLAQEKGLTVPVNETITNMIKAKERLARRPS